MLLSISVRNIALIESLRIEFGRGMNIFSGETGAGKSIIVDSISLVLGERADKSLIRSGCEKAVVEADFDATPQALDLLREQEIDPDGKVITIQREISISDRNICRVCGTVVPVAFVRSLTDHLVDLHGQHAHQSLLDEKKHLPFLDSFGDETFRQQKESVASAWNVWKEASRAFASLRKENTRMQERQEYLKLRVAELKKAAVEKGEKVKLEEERKKLAALEKTDSALRYAYEILHSGVDGGALQLLKQSADSVGGVSAIGPEYEEINKRLKAIYYDLQECTIDLRNRLEAEQFDPERNEKVMDRLDAIRRLEKRFGMEADAMAEELEKASDELASYSDMDVKLNRAESAYKKALRAYRDQAAVLTQMRHDLAGRFENLLMRELGDLGMKNTVFKCVFDTSLPPERVKPSPDGDDTVTFHISPNPGEPLSPLDKTASGGELSRVMLAMKSAGAQQDAIPTLIFDEIDTGISGIVAQAVAEKMASISRFHQVLCITHLAQIAAMADQHFLVSKHVADGRTLSGTTTLDEEGKVGEIARLIGVINTEQESGILHAREILKEARSFKTSNLSDFQNLKETEKNYERN